MGKAWRFVTAPDDIYIQEVLGPEQPGSETRDHVCMYGVVVFTASSEEGLSSSRHHFTHVWTSVFDPGRLISVAIGAPLRSLFGPTGQIENCGRPVESAARACRLEVFPRLGRMQREALCLVNAFCCLFLEPCVFNPRSRV